MPNYAVHVQHGQPRTENCDEEYLIAFDISQQNSSRKRVQKIYEQFQYCVEHGFFAALPTGFIISKGNIESGQYHKPDYLFNVINGRCDSEFLFEKPAGKYAIIDHKGSRENISASYEKLKSYIMQNQLTIIGNGYEFELLNYMTTGNPENYIIEIAIEVK